MRRIVMFDKVSADGYFAAADGNPNWTVPEPELDREATTNMAAQGTLLFGRMTYEMFASFWPTATDEAPHSGGRRSPEIRAMGTYINQAVKLVLSRTLKQVSWQGARILGAFDPEVIAAIKREPGSDIMIFGSGTIVSLLAKHGLIDEYRFVVSPLLLGRGRPVIAGLDSTVPLKLVEARSYPQGSVVLRYTPRG
jgi:dihydrofolate reductase